MAWRLAFAGAPSFASTILARLMASRHEVGLVYTQPPRPTGRGRKVLKSPVHESAEIAGVDVRTPIRLSGEESILAEFDWLVVAAYGLLLPQSILDAPKHHCLNVHASLLPRWRGAAPVERAIMAGDDETGISVMRIEAKLDSGPVYRQRRMPLGDRASGARVGDELADLGAAALLEVLEDLPDLEPEPQDDALATYAKKLTSSDSIIDWSRDADAIDRQVRALSGRAAAFTTAREGIRLRLLEAQPAGQCDDLPPGPPGMLRRIDNRWQIACGAGALAPVTVQLNRGKGTAMPIESAANGFPKLLFDGARFGYIGDE